MGGGGATVSSSCCPRVCTKCTTGADAAPRAPPVDTARLRTNAQFNATAAMMSRAAVIFKSTAGGEGDTATLAPKARGDSHTRARCNDCRDSLGNTSPRRLHPRIIREVTHTHFVKDELFGWSSLSLRNVCRCQVCTL